ncbi:UNVERIFIED_CONTAM: hypothetical protein Sindi_2551800 [Sesamum indicum]
MEAALLSGSLRLPIIRRLSSRNPSGRRRNALLVHAKQGDQRREGESVDENSFLLSIRIKKTKAVESIERRVLWSEGERKVSVDCNDQGVVEAVELLKSCFGRPNVAAVGVVLLGLVVLSVVPLTTNDVVGSLVRVVNGLLAGSHVSVDIYF